jgi:hypothetical protein
LLAALPLLEKEEPPLQLFHPSPAEVAVEEEEGGVVVVVAVAVVTGLVWGLPSKKRAMGRTLLTVGTSATACLAAWATARLKE